MGDLPEIPEFPEEQKPSLEPGFKQICMRMGLVIIAIFGFRILATLVTIPLNDWFMTLEPFTLTVVNALYTSLFLYVLPMLATMFALKRPIKNSENKIYSKPKYFGKAMAMFPAGYGLAIVVRLLTILLSMLFEGTAMGDSFKVVQDSLLTADGLGTAIVLFIQLTVIAPIAEEIWFRGMVMESLRPYGNGFAILVSAILFGLTHANLEQFFYATALGIFLGYIAVSTKSIVSTIIMHALFNSISGIMVLFSVEPSFQEYLLAESKGEAGVVTPMVVLYFVYMGFVALLLVVGIIMLIAKLVKIKKYKVPKVQTELSTGKRWKTLLTRGTVIVGLVLTVIVFIEPVIIKFIQDLFDKTPA